MEIFRIFRKNLNFYFKLRGISSNQLANEVKVSKMATSRWIRGIYMPSYDKLIPLAKALNVTVDALFKK